MAYLGEFEQLILFALLDLGTDAYGVAIRESIEERTGRAVSSGAIYTTLGRLEERGMVSVRSERPTEGPGRPRKYYDLEPAGVRALMEAYETIRSMADGLIPKLGEVAEGYQAPSGALETALDEAAWDSFSRGSAIRRAGRVGFARNVCVGLGNWGSPKAVPVLTSALSDPEPLVRTHAAWALGRVGSAEARDALSSRASVEPDEWVRSEIETALGP